MDICCYRIDSLLKRTEKFTFANKGTYRADISGHDIERYEKQNLIIFYRHIQMYINMRNLYKKSASILIMFPQRCF